MSNTGPGGGSSKLRSEKAAMRQIGILPDGKQAETLADYLLTLQINTRLDHQPAGWEVWVCDEDKVDRARQELAAFLQQPDDARYQQATRTARSLRLQEARTEQDYQHRQTAFRERMTARPGHPMRRPCTLALIGLSLLAAALTNLGDGPFTDYLKIASHDMRPLWQVRQGEVWRLVTPIFIHFGPAHLVFNMMALYVLGGPIEERRGPVRYLLLVLVLALSSNLGQYFLGFPVFLPGGAFILVPLGEFGGMSGVDFGLFGYLWMKTRLEPQLGLEIDPGLVRFLLAWYFLCLFGVVGWVTGVGVANVNHTFGLGTGIVIGAVPWLLRSTGEH
jgi:GlpG protein